MQYETITSTIKKNKNYDGVGRFCRYGLRTPTRGLSAERHCRRRADHRRQK